MGLLHPQGITDHSQGELARRVVADARNDDAAGHRRDVDDHSGPKREAARPSYDFSSVRPPQPARRAGNDAAGFPQLHALMLDATTEICRLAPCGQLLDAMSAARALFLRLALYGHDAPILFVRLR